MIDNNLLEYLAAFIEYGSLLKASEVLHISQPSMSKAMQKLENQLGITIFDRKANKISLNENGQKILPYITEVINTNRILERKVKEVKENNNSIAIGYTAPGIIYKYPKLFLSNPLKIKVSSTIDKEENLISGLINNVFDVIFINNKLIDERFICKKIMTEHLFISIPKDHFLVGMKDGVYWKDIDGQSFLLFSYIGYWHKILKENLFKSRYIENSSQEDLKELNKYSSIPSFVTNVSMSYNSYSNRINIPILNDNAYLDFYIVYKKERKDIVNYLK